MNRLTPEREALVHQLSASWISKVVFSQVALHNHVIQNPDTPVGSYVQAHADKMGPAQAHTQWLINTPISNTMPVEQT